MTSTINVYKHRMETSSGGLEHHTLKPQFGLPILIMNYHTKYELHFIIDLNV